MVILYSFSINREPNYTLINLEGRAESDNSPNFAANIYSLTQSEGRFRIVFDLTNLTFISAEFLLAIRAAYNQSKRFNRGNVFFVEANAEVREVLNGQQYPNDNFFDTIEEAIAAFE